MSGNVRHIRAGRASEHRSVHRTKESSRASAWQTSSTNLSGLRVGSTLCTLAHILEYASRNGCCDMQSAMKSSKHAKMLFAQQHGLMSSAWSCGQGHLPRHLSQTHSSTKPERHPCRYVRGMIRGQPDHTCLGLGQDMFS